MDDLRTIAFPLILDEQGTVSFFSSLDILISSLEAIDVREGNYRFFDSQGQELLAICGDQSIAIHPTGISRLEELRNVLVNALIWARQDGGFHIEIDDYSLDKPIDYLLERVKRFSVAR